MNMLLSLDTIPRMHNILVLLFVWILLAGFVIIPGAFTSTARKQEGSTVELPVGSGSGVEGEKLALTPANTAAMVLGFVCILTGLFGSAWLALRWRRNYVWLLNKLYMPLVLNAVAGVIATLTGVYTQQAGEWSPQAIVTAIVEGVVLVGSGVLFFVYNHWLLQRLKGDHEEVVTGGGGREKKKKKHRGWGRKREKEEREEREETPKKEKKKGFGVRFKHARTKRPVAAGSFV
jgi:cytochrome b subunit of formate dehydrogenase